MIGSKYVWIILGDYAQNWWNAKDDTLSCTPQQLKLALRGYITTEILPVATQERLTIANLVRLSYIAHADGFVKWLHLTFIARKLSYNSQLSFSQTHIIGNNGNIDIRGLIM